MNTAAQNLLQSPIRDSYLDYDTLTATVKAWAAAHPDVVRLSSIGQSREGRELWLLTLGEEPDRDRPSAWVDGNMHATEVAGTNVALAIAEAKIRLHVDPANASTRQLGLPAHVLSTLRELRFFILPRVSPDGAEVVLKEGRYVRSLPHDARHLSAKPRWKSGDVNGDGKNQVMRVHDASGEYVESTEIPGFMLPRELEDAGPFYKLYPEGVIEHFDGSIPDPYYLSDNETDLNRNFPFSWKPEPDQAGAGTYPLSEPESRAIVEFTSRTPSIFAWLNLHTFGGVYIRPLGDAADEKMNPEDLAVWKQIGAYCEKFGGYPMVSGFAEFTYEPDKPLYGDLCDYAYLQRGALAYVCELWDIFSELGLPAKKRFVDRYVELSREDWIKLAKWDVEKNQSRIQTPWTPFVHPQLGPLEIGGMDIRVGISNPPNERLGEVCDKQVAAFFRVAALAPTVRAECKQIEKIGETTRVVIEVENIGYLPTYVVAGAQKLTHNGPLYCEASTTDDLTLLDKADAAQTLGHLRGYGRGMHAVSLFGPSSEGSVSRKQFTIMLQGKGVLTLRIGCHRTGFTNLRLDLN